MRTLKPLSNILNDIRFNNHTPIEQEIIIPPEAISIVNGLFKDLKGVCTAWQHTFTDKSIEQAAKQQWSKALFENGVVNQQQIDTGMKKARKLAKPWFPSSGEFISWCKPNLEDYGLPNAEQALRKVINGQKRSHPVLYAAAQATGSRELKTMSHTDLLKLFTRNYEITCQNFINGGDFSQVIPKALPEKVYVVSEQKVRLRNASNLREILKQGAA
jgi:hypothetical protein